MDSGRLRRLPGARLFGKGARLLRSGTPLAQRQGRADSAGVKIRIYYLGKPRDPHTNALAEDYIRRISHYAKTEMSEARPRGADPWERHPSAQVIALDPAGKPLD